jgi:hypothetical protein
MCEVWYVSGQCVLNRGRCYSCIDGMIISISHPLPDHQTDFIICNNPIQFNSINISEPDFLSIGWSELYQIKLFSTITASVSWWGSYLYWYEWSVTFRQSINNTALLQIFPEFLFLRFWCLQRWVWSIGRTRSSIVCNQRLCYSCCPRVS